jgi:hypothetical protein
MTGFPALIPSTRSYSPGEFPHTAHPLLSGSEIRVRHSNTVLGVRLRLTFTAITSADLVAVRNHYRDRQGGFLPFAIPAELLSGIATTADFTPTGHQWRYAARPSVTDVPIPGTTPTNRHDLVLELESVPPENTIVGGARITVRATVRGGSAQLGAFIESFASVVSGAATVEASTSALGAAITTNVAFAAGPASGDDSLTAVVLLSAGAASAAAADPDFANVSLLLHMDGSNGSTTFTDSSSNALTVTAVGNAQISTAQSQWGGASLLLDQAGDYLDVSGSALFSFPGAFSIQGWVRMNSPISNYQTLCEIGDASNGVLVRVSTASAQGVFVNGTSLGQINAAFTSATWGYVSVTRDDDDLVEVAVDATVLLSATVAGTVNSTNAGVKIGVGASPPGQVLAGYIDDFRITKGVARPHTVPTAPFPDS